MEIPPALEQLVRSIQQGDLTSAKRQADALVKQGGTHLQLAAEVLHELRQPLLGVKALAQLMLEHAGAESPLHSLLLQVDRMEQIVSDFTRLVSDKPSPKERVNLSLHARQAVRAFSLSADSARTSVEVDALDELWISGNGRLLEQLILNLLNNARDAMSGLGRIKLVVTREGTFPLIYVADWGPGIPAELRDRIFEPYVTSKARGSGLGLSVCRRIAHDHGAEIGLGSASLLRDSPPPATVFKVRFPPSEGAGNAKKRVLVVDDELIIRSVFRDLMGRECDLVDVETAEAALELLKAGSFDLIVTDKNLPGLSGLDLAQEARRLNPRSRVMVMTGYPSVVTAQQALELGVVDYLLKPFDDIREVREKIRAALVEQAPQQAFVATTRRIDVYEDNPASAHQIVDALQLLGLEANLVPEPKPSGDTGPAGVVISWDYSPAPGHEAVSLGREVSRGAPFIILAEHLTMETALDCLRGGASACLPKLLSDVRALSRELSRALRLSA